MLNTTCLLRIMHSHSIYVCISISSVITLYGFATVLIFMPQNGYREALNFILDYIMDHIIDYLIFAAV